MINVQKIEARYNCEMTKEDLIKLFDNEYTTQGTMFNDDPESLIDSYETDKLLEINVQMTYGHEITIFYDERKIYIDLCSGNHIGLGNTLISPIKDIKSIEVKWR